MAPRSPPRFDPRRRLPRALRGARSVQGATALEDGAASRNWARRPRARWTPRNWRSTPRPRAGWPARAQGGAVRGARRVVAGRARSSGGATFERRASCLYAAGARSRADALERRTSKRIPAFGLRRWRQLAAPRRRTRRRQNLRASQRRTRGSVGVGVRADGRVGALGAWRRVALDERRARAEAAETTEASERADRRRKPTGHAGNRPGGTRRRPVCVCVCVCVCARARARAWCARPKALDRSRCFATARCVGSATGAHSSAPFGALTVRDERAREASSIASRPAAPRRSLPALVGARFPRDAGDEVFEESSPPTTAAANASARTRSVRSARGSPRSRRGSPGVRGGQLGTRGASRHGAATGGAVAIAEGGQDAAPARSRRVVARRGRSAPPRRGGERPRGALRRANDARRRETRRSRRLAVRTAASERVRETRGAGRRAWAGGAAERAARRASLATRARVRRLDARIGARAFLAWRRASGASRRWRGETAAASPGAARAAGVDGVGAGGGGRDARASRVRDRAPRPALARGARRGAFEAMRRHAASEGGARAAREEEARRRRDETEADAAEADSRAFSFSAAAEDAADLFRGTLAGLPSEDVHVGFDSPGSSSVATEAWAPATTEETPERRRAGEESREAFSFSAAPRDRLAAGDDDLTHGGQFWDPLLDDALDDDGDASAFEPPPPPRFFLRSVYTDLYRRGRDGDDDDAEIARGAAASYSTPRL